MPTFDFRRLATRVGIAITVIAATIALQRLDLLADFNSPDEFARFAMGLLTAAVAIDIEGFAKAVKDAKQDGPQE